MDVSLMATKEEDRGKDADELILDEAKDRFKRWEEWEGDFRKLYLEDVKFAWADSDNKWQWPNDMQGQTQANDRPRLTVNKVSTHVKQVTNEARKKKAAIIIKPVGEMVSFKAAEVWEGLVRSIERNCSADNVYDDAIESAVEGGIGYCRVTTDYIDDDSFDQEIRIVPVQDHMGVALDTNIKQKDGSDAKWGFVFEDIPRKEFEKEYPEVDLPPSTAIGLNERDNWVRIDTVRVAEYYRIVIKKDELIYIEDDQGESATFRRSDVPAKWKDLIDQFDEDNPDGRMKKRPIKVNKLEWYKIAGNEIVGRRKLKGKYIPIIRFLGREKRIDGKLERKGLVRPLKDPQRMYNYNTSGQVETAAMQTKTPWLVSAEAIEGNELTWNNANAYNMPYLPWRSRDSDGNEIPQPTRVEPPKSAEACIMGMKIAAAEMEMASGQYQPQREQNANNIERSPRAIDERVGVGETSTYDFVDNAAASRRHIGNIILDLAPHTYDTHRVVKILAKDGSLQDVTISPDLSEAHQETQEEEEVRILFNPKIGRYAVEADVGPAYATQRQEAWNAFINIVSNSPELTAKIGDLGFLAADFPMADKIAERLRRDIKANAPWLLDDKEVGPFVKQLQQQIEMLTADGKNKDQSIGELLAQLASEKVKAKGKEEKREVEVYRAETDRIGILGNTVTDMTYDVLKPIIRQTLAEMLGFTLSGPEHDLQDTLDQQLHEADTAPPAPPSGGKSGE
jgi:Phage P22-like portal protein